MYSSSYNPFAPPSVYVDKELGTSYEVVRFVAQHLPLIHYTSQHIEDMLEFKKNFPETRVIRAASFNPSSLYTLPDDISLDNIINYTVAIKTPMNMLYSGDNGVFNTHINNRALVFSWNIASATFAGGELIWSITHRG